MPAWWIVLVIALVVAAFGVAVLPNEIRVWRRASQRRGGLLELDTPGARAAIADPLRRCRPARGVHYHGDGDHCECGELTSSRRRSVA